MLTSHSHSARRNQSNRARSAIHQFLPLFEIYGSMMPIKFFDCRKLIGPGMLCCFASACIPLPATHYHAPQITGVLLEHGQPVVDAEVRLISVHTTTETFISTTRTDTSGQFSIGPITNVRIIGFPLGDPIYNYELTMKSGGQNFRGIDYHNIGFMPHELRIFCDLSMPLPTVVYADRMNYDHCIIDEPS